jgi:2,4-dienoyl-CoA reductase-like NADH-dependent reductase (Old Yellow Enzyme family)
MMMNVSDLNNLDYARKNYPNIFSPFRIKNIEIPNRVVFPPMLLKFCNSDGMINEKTISFYTKLADGGCGLIITGAAGTSKNSVSPVFNGAMRADDDKYIPGLAELFRRIKERGSVAGLQLAHGGRQTPTPAPGFEAILAPSNVPIPLLSKISPSYKLKVMSLADIKNCINDFIEGGLRGVKAGADVIEFHFGHGYLPAQFLSARSNKRTDEYGGSLENRTRFLVEIIKGFREKAGHNIVISTRLSAKEFLDEGIEPEDYQVILPRLEDAGVDLLNVSVGTRIESSERCIPGSKFGEAPHVDIIAQVKQYTKLPIITVGSIPTLDIAENILVEKKAELVAIGRTQVADANFVVKSANGKKEEIRKCLRCNQCCIITVDNTAMHCAVNPDYKK